MTLIDGYKLAEELDEKIQSILSEKKFIGTLGIIQIGDNASSNKYISIKQKVGQKLGIPTQLFKLDETLSDESIEKEVRDIVSREDITSVIIQLPLPRKSLDHLLELIPLEKDVDMLSPESQTKYYSNSPHFVSPIIRATSYVLNSMNFVFPSSKVLIVGEGFLVGKPLKKMFEDKGCIINVTDNYTKEDGQNKDLVILSTGVFSLVKGEDLSTNTSVVDFGSKVVEGKTKGDLDMSSDLSHLGFIVPSPGGMGPLVVRFLFLNHLRVSNETFSF